jgi:hypothetical protein
MSSFKFGKKYYTYSDDPIIASAYAISEMMKISGIPKVYLGRRVLPYGNPGTGKFNIKNNE